MKKRILATSVVVTVASTALAACGGAPKHENPPGPEPEMHRNPPAIEAEGEAPPPADEASDATGEGTEPDAPIHRNPPAPEK